MTGSLISHLFERCKRPRRIGRMKYVLCVVGALKWSVIDQITFACQVSARFWKTVENEVFENTNHQRNDRCASFDSGLAARVDSLRFNILTSFFRRVFSARRSSLSFTIFSTINATSETISLPRDSSDVFVFLQKPFAIDSDVCDPKMQKCKKMRVPCPLFFFMKCSKKDQDKRFVREMDAQRDPYQIQTTLLENGLRCLLIDTPGDIFFTGMYLKCGFDDETKDTLQAAHYLEHLNAAFTSSKYPDAQYVSSVFDSVGVQSNASTANKESTYWFSGPVSHANALLDIFTQSIIDFQLDRKILSQEANAVREELKNSWKNNTWYEANTFLDSLMYPQHIRAENADAHIANVSRLEKDPEKLLSFRAKWYTPDVMAWVLAGPLQRLPYADTIQKLSTIRSDSAPRRIEYTSAVSKPPGIYRCTVPSVSSTRITIIIPVRITAKDTAERQRILFLRRILAGGFSSRFIKRLRTELGIVYSVSVHMYVDETQPEFSYLKIQTTTSKEKTQHFITEVTELLKPDVLEKEFEKLVNLNESNFSRRKYDSSPQSIAEELASDFLWTDKHLTFFDLHAMRQKMLQAKDVTISVLHKSPLILIADPPAPAKTPAHATTTK